MFWSNMEDDALRCASCLTPMAFRKLIVAARKGPTLQSALAWMPLACACAAGLVRRTTCTHERTIYFAFIMSSAARRLLEFAETAASG